MITVKRRQHIIELLRERSSMSIHELLTELNSSPATVRRDLAFLESERKIVRTHGGAMCPKHLASEPSFSIKQTSAQPEKREIAHAAMNLEHIGGAINIDAGTTCLELGRRLVDNTDASVYTNSLPLLYYAANSLGEVISIGGTLRKISHAFVGGQALGCLDKLYFDWAFVGASGLLAYEGAFTTELLEAELKAKVLNRSRKKVLLCDSSKWEQPATVHFAKWSDFDYWVCDDGLPGTVRNSFKKANTSRLIIA